MHRNPPPFTFVDQPRELDRKRRESMAIAVSEALAYPDDVGPGVLCVVQSLAAGAADRRVEEDLDKLLVTCDAPWSVKRQLQHELLETLRQLGSDTVEYVFEKALRAEQAHAREQRSPYRPARNPGRLPREFMQDVWIVGQGHYDSPSIIVTGIYKRKADAIHAASKPGHVLGLLVNWSSGALPEEGQRLEVVWEYAPTGLRRGEGRPGFYPYFHPHTNPPSEVHWMIDGRPACEVLPAGAAPCCGRRRLIEHVAKEYAVAHPRCRVEVMSGGCPAEGLRRGGR